MTVDTACHDDDTKRQDKDKTTQAEALDLFIAIRQILVWLCGRGERGRLTYSEESVDSPFPLLSRHA